MPKLTVNIKAKVEETEPDGSECIICGNKILFKAYCINLYCDQHYIKHTHNTQGQLCCSCGEALKQRQKGN